MILALDHFLGYFNVIETVTYSKSCRFQICMHHLDQKSNRSRSPLLLLNWIETQQSFVNLFFLYRLMRKYGYSKSAEICRDVDIWKHWWIITDRRISEKLSGRKKHLKIITPITLFDEGIVCEKSWHCESSFKITNKLHKQQSIFL